MSTRTGFDMSLFAKTSTRLHKIKENKTQALKRASLKARMNMVSFVWLNIDSIYPFLNLFYIV